MKTTLAKILCNSGCTVSMSQGRRLVVCGAVQVNGEVKNDLEAVEVKEGDVVKVGKRQEFVVTKEMLSEAANQ
jgi:ribosomal protein S4